MQLEPALRQNADAPPGLVASSKDLRDDLLSMRIAIDLGDVFVDIDHTIVTRVAFELLDHIEDASKQIDRFKACDSDRDPKFFTDRFISLIAGDRTDIACSQESIDTVAWI